MIIIDTSIWIDFFKAKDSYFDKVKQHIEKNEVIALEVVFSELVQGCKNDRELNIIDEYWKNLRKFSEEDILLNAAKLSYYHKFIDKGVGLIDSVIIYSAYKLDCKVWTLDKKILSVLNKHNHFIG
jgi:predicted nucleic acid-binding protein